MDPLLFGIDVDVVGEAMQVVVLFSLLVERVEAPRGRFESYQE